MRRRNDRCWRTNAKYRRVLKSGKPKDNLISDVASLLGVGSFWGLLKQNRRRCELRISNPNVHAEREVRRLPTYGAIAAHTLRNALPLSS